MSDNDYDQYERGHYWAYTHVGSEGDRFIPNQLINGIDPFRRRGSRDGVRAESRTRYKRRKNSEVDSSSEQPLPLFEQSVAKEVYNILDVESPDEYISDIKPFQEFWETLCEKQKRRWAVVIVAEAKDDSVSTVLEVIENNQSVANEFGFDDGPPSGSTISRREKPDFISAPPEELITHLRHWARRHAVEIPDSLKPKYGRSETLESDILIEEKIGVCQTLVQDLFSEVIDEIGFDRSSGTGNYRYPTATFYSLLAHLAIENSHPTSGVRTFKWENPELAVPDVGTLYKYINRYPPESIYQKFMTAITRTLNKLNFNGSLNIAYDTTLIPYHGSDDNEWLVDIDIGDQPRGFGTNPADKAWCFGVISAIGEAEQYVLSARLLRSGLDPSDHLRDFFDNYTNTKMRGIGRVVADSQLATESMIKEIQSISSGYLFYARKTTEVEDLLATSASGERNYRKHIPFGGLTGARRPHLFISDRPGGDGTPYEDEDHTAYLTNMDPEILNLRDLAHFYGNRQRVETAIRDVKNTFHAETDSASPSVRSWFFLTACLFYNIHEGLVELLPGEILPGPEFELTGRELLHAMRDRAFVDGVSEQT